MAGQVGPPKYVTIERELRRRVEAAAPGDPLPSEADLCRLFAVSRMTSRQALGVLEREGLVYRVPGRGTFVAARPVHRRMGRLLSFSEEMAQRGLVASSRVLRAERVVAGAEDSSALHLPPGSHIVLIHRVRLAGGVPTALEQVALPPAVAEVLHADLATGSLHAELRRLGRVPTLARGTLVALPATAADAGLLDIPPGSPLLVERRTVFDAAGAPVEHTETRYAGQRYVFDVELASPPDGPADPPGPAGA